VVCNTKPASTRAFASACNAPATSYRALYFRNDNYGTEFLSRVLSDVPNYCGLHDRHVCLTGAE
jgi:hypothetical protein